MSPPVPRASRGFLWLVGTLGLAATAISAIGSWIPSLWGDEAASLLSAKRSLPSLWMMLGHVDAVHGTYYFGLHWWIRIFGTSPFSLRFPSAIAIGVTVVAVTLIASRLSSRRVAIAAGIICAVLPRVTYMGEEARSYAFSAAIAAWLTLILIEILRRKTPPKWLWFAYGGLFSLGIYVFLYLALFAVVHGIILMATRVSKRLLITWLWTIGIAVVVASPVIVLAISERAQIAYLDSRSEVTFASLTVGLWFGSIEFAVLAWALIVTALALAIRRRFGRSRDVPRTRVEGRGMMPSLELVAACWLLVPAVILIASQPLIAVYTARYLSYGAPAAALLIASALGWIGSRSRWVFAIAVALVVASAVPAYLSQRGEYAKNDSDWANISEFLKTHASRGDALAFDETAQPSRRPRLVLHTYPDGVSGLLDVALKTPYFRNKSWEDTAYTIAHAAERGRLDGVHRLWLIEYATPEQTGTYGIADLGDLGFVKSATFSTHSSVIYEFTR